MFEALLGFVVLACSIWVSSQLGLQSRSVSHFAESRSFVYYVIVIIVHFILAYYVTVFYLILSILLFVLYLYLRFTGKLHISHAGSFDEEDSTSSMFKSSYSSGSKGHKRFR